MTYDLILRGGRVIDPSQNLNQVGDVAFSGGKVAAVGGRIEGVSAEVRDVSGFIVTPGLIDLHTHVYWGGTSLGVDADEFCRESGVTTSVDTGSAGPGNFAGFRRHVIERAESRILAFLHVSFAGIYAFSKGIMVGESEEMRLMAPREAIDVANANRDCIVGIKVRIGARTSENNGTAPLKVALDVAGELELPVMVHIDDPPPSYDEVVEMLRPGDILTHAFRPPPNTPCRPEGEVKQVVREARKSGVLFDIGHGKGSLSFDVARKMLAGGFHPDTISSDIHALCIDGPVYDQVTTLSKFLCLGMKLDDVIKATTVNAAGALRRPELGSLRPGSVGDASILLVREGQFDYYDVTGECLTGREKITSEGVVLGGRFWYPRHAEKFRPKMSD